MVDEVISSDEEFTESSFTIKPDNVFIDNGVFVESGLVENIAQTMALRGGVIRIREKRDAPIGLIGAIKNLKVYRLPEVGTTIQTKIKIEYEVLMATIIKGEVFQDDEVLAECEMKIFLKKEE